MCLIINKKQCSKGYKTARKNIPCYKIVIKKVAFKYETPYRGTTVDVKTNLEADYFQTDPYEIVEFTRRLGKIRIDHGIHSYTNLKTAKEAKKEIFGIKYPLVYSRNIRILKAFIPKGTKYWVGKHHQFCSERIIFEKK